MIATYLLQCLTSALALVTGWYSLAVSRKRQGSDEYHRVAWWVTGTAFMVFGVDAALANVFQGLALSGGSSSAVWAAYLRWAAVFNHSRTVLMLGTLTALLLLAFWRTLPGRSFTRAATALIVAGVAIGAAFGVVKGQFSFTAHLFDVVVSDVVELLLLLATLFVLLVTNRADRLLWALFSAYACSVALGIFWLSLLTHIDSGWYPPVWTTHAVRNVFYVLMAAAAFKRFSAANRGRIVYGMLGRPITQLSTLH